MIYVFIKLQNWSPHLLRFLIGCIYRLPNIDLDEFNDNYLNILLDKISKENKSVFLLGDFNVDLLKYDKPVPTNDLGVTFFTYASTTYSPTN